MDFTLPTHGKSIEGQVKELISDRKDSHKPKSHNSVFRELYHTDLPPNKGTLSRLSQGVWAVWARSEIIRKSLTVPKLHPLSKPDKARRLRKEPTDAIPHVRAIPS